MHRTSDRKGFDDLSESLVTVSDPGSSAAEAYRSLRATLLYAPLEPEPTLITLTSPGPQEGKSTTCANLGVVLAQVGKRVLVVDCDFRRPVQHKIFEVRNHFGVVDVVTGQHSVDDVWHEPLPRLHLLTVGSIPPDPTELLSSQRFAKFLWQLRQKADYVLVDAPPVGMVSDPTMLANQSDYVIMVLDAQRTRKASVRKSIRRLESVGGTVLGTVMNKIKV